MKIIPILIAIGATLQAADHAVSTSAELQAALNKAAPGDTITLASGKTFQGNFVIPAKPGSNPANPITIRSSQFTNGTTGVRVSPADAAKMAKVVAPSAQPGFRFASQAANYRLTGVEILPVAGVYSYDLIQMGATEKEASLLPQNIQIDHCYIHGDPGKGSKRGIALNGVNVKIHDNYISDIKSNFQDSQAILGWNGGDKIWIFNNYLEATGENIMFGGATPPIRGAVPSNITIQQNYFRKPLEWKGQPWVVKNLLEFKSGRHVRVIGNILENCWVKAQIGMAVNVTPRTEWWKGQITAPWITVEDLTFEYNIVRNADQFLLIAGTDDSDKSNTQRLLGATFRHNLIYDIGHWGFIIKQSPKDLVIDHNTVVQKYSIVNLSGGGDAMKATGFQFTNNLISSAGYGIYGDNTGSGEVALKKFFPAGYTFSGNVLFGYGKSSGAGYPKGTKMISDISKVGFADVEAKNFILASSKKAKNAEDSPRPGANVERVDALTAGVVEGRIQNPVR